MADEARQSLRARRLERIDELIEIGRVARERGDELTPRIELALRRARFHPQRLRAIRL